MPTNRSYYVDQHDDGGYHCFCHAGDVLMDKRHFSNEDAAVAHGEDWCASVNSYNED